MDIKDKEKINSKNESNDEDMIQPDPETLHTTDPQEKMEGPVSSAVQAGKKIIEENAEATKKEEKKD